jgi:Bacterial Ig domain/SMP-30/Gluconolactonase/LRE-like region
MRLRNRWFGLTCLVTVLVTVLAACTGATTNDTSKPTVSLTSSSTNVTAPGSITLNATASDDTGVTNVEFFEASTKLGEKSTAPYELSMSLTAANNGSRTFTAKASDAAGNNATSSAVTVTINVAPNKGTLSITFANLPPSTTGSADVTGPNGFQQTVNGTSTATLNNLTPGSYTVSSGPIRVKKSVVDSIFESTPASANLTVTADVTTKHTIDHAQRPGTGTLWIPTNNGFVKGYTDAQLALTGAVAPLESRVQAGVNDQVVFDKDGVAYVSNPGDNAIYGPSTIKGAATKLNRPRGMAFDKNGNLWVANPGNFSNSSDDTIVAFSPAQLAQGGNLAPSIVLTSTSFHDPIGLAFDFKGTLWISNFSETLTAKPSVFGLGANDLQTTGTVVPATSVIDFTQSPDGLAVDSAGNLWVTSEDKTVLEYTKSDLESGGSALAVPNLTLTGFSATPRGLAFDNAGNLWVVLVEPGNTSNGSLEEILLENLGGTGSQVRQTARTITGFGTISIGMPAFNPTPSNLPIQNK